MARASDGGLGEGKRTLVMRVPDGDSEAFRAEAHRQSAAVAASARAAEDQAFVDAVGVWRDGVNSDHNGCGR